MSLIPWDDLHRCSICPNTNRCVHGDGPVPSPYLFIGEAPGRDEDYYGIPFIGDAGREFNENYLELAGLQRDTVYITNTVKCRPNLNRKPSAGEAAGCASRFLPHELSSVNPTVVFLMGAVACSLVPGVDLEVEHGIPRKGELFGWTGWVVPMFHPARGLHDSSTMIPQLEDWARLRKWLRDSTWMWAVDQHPDRDYRLAESCTQIDNYFDDYGEDQVLVGVDTETHAGMPWSVQVSVRAGTGMMVRFGTRDNAMAQLAQHLRWYMPVFHNAEADLDIVRGIGVKVEQYRDTMQELYQLGNFLRLGLKVASYRVLGRKRPSWEEVVTPPSKFRLAQWLLEAQERVETWRTVNPRFGVRGQPIKPEILKHPAEGEIQHMLGFVMKPDYKCWDKIKEFHWETWLEYMELELGQEIPKLGIANCELADAVHYGCSDADDTLALALELETLRSCAMEQWSIDPGDVDEPV